MSVRDSRLAALWPYALVLAIGLVVLVPRMGDFGFWDPWEPKYAQSTREMLERDSFVVPYYRGEVRLTKPILTYWGIMTGAKLFGMNEFGARFVGVVLALATLLSVCYAVTRVRGVRAGVLSAAVLATVPQFFFISRQAMPDVYQFTTLGCAVLFFALALLHADARRNVHFAISYVCVSLAVMAKGPVVTGTIFLLPLLIYAFCVIDWHLLWRRDLRSASLRLAGVAFVGLPLCAALAATAGIFGTSSEWWGYSEERRAEVELVRQETLYQITRLHLVEILLAALTIAAVAVVVRSYRRAPRDVRSLATGALAGLLALGSLASLVWHGPERQTFVAAALGVIVVVGLISTETRRFVLLPALWARLEQPLGTLLRQLALASVILLVVAGPWHIAILFKQSSGYFTDFILKHNVNRALEKINQTGYVDFYVRVVIFGFFPWVCVIPAALASAVGWWERNPLRRYGFEIYMLLAAVVTFVSFSSIVTKFPYYLAPLLVPLAVLVGIGLDRMFDKARSVSGRIAWIVTALFYAAPMFDLIERNGLRLMIGSFTVKRYIPPEMRDPPTLFTAILVAFLVCLVVFALFRSKIVLGVLVASAVAFATYNTVYFIPRVSSQKTMKHLCESWRGLRTADEPIGFHGPLKHGVYFYTDSQFKRLRTQNTALEFIAPDNPVFLVLERKRYDDLDSAYRKRYAVRGLRIVDNSHFDYILVANHKPPT